MKTNPHDIDDRIVLRYTDQPAALPAELRERIEQSWGGGSVQLYALADLDASLHLAWTWVVLGPTHVAIVPLGAPISPSTSPEIRWFERAHITAIHAAPGLSATLLTIVGVPG